MYGGTTTKVLNVAQQAVTVCAVVFVVAGGTVALIASRDTGFALIAAGVLFALVLLLLRLYRGRYRL